MEVVNCNTELKRTVPLKRCVAAAISDLHEDFGRLEQPMTHNIARGLKKITRETLKTGLKKVTLTVNQSTRSATLPPDFDSEEGVYIINREGFKVPLKLNNKIVDSKNIEDIPCEDECPVCHQDKAICEDIKITEETVYVVVNGITAQQTIIKKCYPNGDFYLETRIPVWDVESSGIIYTTTKEFITHIDLKDCGCIDETPENIDKIRCLCPDVWCTYYAPCDNNCIVDYGGYRIFDDNNIIYFDNPSHFVKVYIEYWGYMIKKNGQYHVPEFAFETLVEYGKDKWLWNKRNIPRWERQDQRAKYREERASMEKLMGRIGLSQIIQAIGLIPKFDLDYNPEMWCSGYVASYNTVGATANGSVSSSSSGTAVTDTTPSTSGCNDEPVPPQECPCPPPMRIKSPFQLAVVAGVGGGPVAGTHLYTNSALKDAMDVGLIIVNNMPETVLGLQFTFNPVTGQIARYQADGVTPNPWQTSDVLIVPYSKIIFDLKCCFPDNPMDCTNDIINYNLTIDTEIANIDPANVSNVVTFNIRPNGFNYTWGSIFAFSDNWPEQPGANAVNTMQVYTFQYNSTINKYVCIGQSLNIPV